MMTVTVSEIWSSTLSVALAVSPAIAVIVLLQTLNRRDHRRERLLSRVASHFPAVILRSDVVIEARCSMLAGRGVVRVDVRHESEEVRHVVSALRQSLPAGVRLRVDGPSWPRVVDLPKGTTFSRPRARDHVAIADSAAESEY